STLAGHIVESVIGFYLKGIAGIDVSWFPERHGEPEIDFVLTIGTARLPIEVKYTRRLKPKDLRGLEAFCRQPKYNAPFGLLITQQTAGPVSNCVIAVPAYAFLALH